MSEFFHNKKFFLTAVIIFLVPVFSAYAALSAPVLSDPVSNCSGSSPYVSLSWTAVSGATTYHVLRDSVQIADVPEIIYDDFAVSGKESHTYIIVASDGVTLSPNSNSKSIVVARCGPVLNSAVTSCTVGGPKISLSWNSLTGASGYDILRDGTVIASLSGGTTSYSDDNTTGSLLYNYKVRAKWADNDTKDSNELIGIVSPACPTNLTETADCNAPGAEANLSWNIMPGASSYQIFRSGSFLADISGNSYIDDTVGQKSTYSYFIRAIYPSDVADSNTTLMEIPRCAPVLTTQSVCNATNQTIPEIQLTWEGTANSTLYNITETVKGFIVQLTGNPPATSYKDIANISNGTTYTYSVEAQGNGFDLISNQSSVTPNCVASVPSPAPILSSSAICSAGDSQIILSWTSSDNTLYYSLSRTNNSSGSTANFNILSTESGYTDSNVEAGTSYTYTVAAVGNGGPVVSNSVTLTAVSISGCTLPATPTLSNPTASCVSGGSAVNLVWTKSSNATKYQIKRNAVLLTEINNVNTTTYQDLSVNNSTSYNYEVVAVNAAGSATSGIKSVTTLNCVLPLAPTLTLGTSVCSAGATTMSMSWTSSTNASYYDIYRKKSTDASYSYVANTTQLSYTDSVAQNTTYNYFIMAVGAGGSTPSNQDTKTSASCPIPGVPSISVSYSCVAASPTATITWGATTNTNSYNIYRDGALIKNTTATSYIDSGLATNSSFSYQVVAVGYGGTNASVSQPVSTGVCAPPQSLLSGSSVCSAGTPNINISWDSFAGAVAVYNFDDTSTSVATDSSGTGNTATLVNNPTVIAGIYGNARQFNGTNSYLTRSSMLGLTSGNTPHSITAWIKVVGLPPNRAWIAQLGNEGTGSHHWLINSGGGTQFGAWGIWAANPSLPTGVWTHVAMTFDGTTLKSYVNGAFSQSMNLSFNLSGIPFSLAQVHNGENYFNGAFDSVRVYNRALSAAEVAAEYNGTGITSYDIYKNGVKISSVSPSTKIYSDTSGLSSGQSYNYNIIANGPGGSTSSNTISLTAISCNVPEKPALTLSFACNASSPYVTVSWNSTANTTSYDVYRDGVKIASALTVTSYTDNAVSQNQAYSYYVVSNGIGGSASSDTQSITTGYCAPSAPSLGANAICSAGNSVINLSWASSFGLSAGYNFDEGSGTTASDFSGNGNAGTLINGPIWTTGKLGGALSFDGVNDYVSIPLSQSLNILTKSSISAWVKINTWKESDIVESGASGYMLWTAPSFSNKMVWGRQASSQQVFSSTAFNNKTNQWIHIVGTNDGSVLRFYVNGVLDASQSVVASFSNSTVTIGAGISSYSDGYFGGLIDDVRIYNRALSATEILDIYNNGNPLVTSYDIYRNGTKIATVTSNTTTYSDTTAVAGQSYNYSVTAVGPGGSTSSVTVSSTALNCTAPSKPIITVASMCSSGGSGPFPQAAINWGSTSNTNSYDILRDGIKIINVLAGTIQYTDAYSYPSNQILSGTSYSYQVVAKGNAEDVSSDIVSSGALPMCLPTTPSWVAGYPAATCSAGGAAISINWQYAQPRQNSSTFTIKRDDGTGFVDVASIAEGGTCSTAICTKVYTDNNGGAGLNPNKSYTYKIVSNGPTGLVATSASASVTTTSCKIDSLSSNSQCSVPGTNPITDLVFSRLNSDSVYYAAKQASTDPSFNNTYQYIYNSSASSPSIIREWLVLGTFPNSPDPSGFTTDYIAADGVSGINETTIMPRAGETTYGKIWTRYVVPSGTDFVDFNQIYGYPSNIVAYAFAYIVNTSASDITGQIRIGSDDAEKTYVNGVKVLDNHVHRGASPDQDIVAITLKSGINTILVKIDQGSGGWGFYARLTTTSGAPLLNTLTMTDSGAVKSQTSDYYVWSPSSISSPVVNTTAPACTIGKTNLTVTPACVSGGSVMNLSWDVVAGADYYQVWRGDNLGNIAPLVGGVDGGMTTVANYADTLIESNKEYFYVIEAVSGTGSSLSDAVSAVSLVCEVAPDKPILTSANVTPVCAGTAPRVELNWDPAANAISYTVHKDAVALTPSVSTSAFTDAGVSGLTTYTYEVEAVGSGGSTMSDPVNVTTLDCNGPPTPPILNEPLPFPQSLTMLLTWQDKSFNEDGFRVDRTFLCSGNCVAMAPTNLFAQVFRFLAAIVADNLTMDTTLYSDSSSLAEDSTYEYQVTAYNGAGNSVSNPERTYMPIAPPGNFNLNVDCNFSSVAVNLSWTAAGTTVKGGPVTYNAYWSSSQSGNYILLPPTCSADISGTSCAGTVSYPGTIWLKVVARNNGGITEASSSKTCDFVKYIEI